MRRFLLSKLSPSSRTSSDRPVAQVPHMRMNLSLFTRSLAPRVLGLACVALGTLPLAGCQILFWLSLSDDGLPCRTPTPEDPQVCLAGYVCIDNVCRTKAILDEGDPCAADTECQDGLLCRNHYGDDVCEKFDHDLNCVVARSAAKQLDDGLRCRRECNPILALAEQCPPGNYCYPDERRVSNEGGYCQPGTCATDTECGNNAVCIGEATNPDPNGDKGSGRCFRSCNPLTCNSVGGCNGCPIEDTNGDDIDEVMGCEPAELLSQTVCVPAGPIPHRSVCSVTDVCQAGAFCPSDVSRCLPYCASNGGAPACNTANGEVCVNVDNNFGYCQL